VSRWLACGGLASCWLACGGLAIYGLACGFGGLWSEEGYMVV
jgi:hypothetical protein